MPEQTIIEAKDYPSRMELEKYVRNKYGLTPDRKEHSIIHGSRLDLARLHLSDTSVFWGISCVETDAEPKQPSVAPGIDRGPQSDFGIDDKLNKNPNEKTPD